MKKLILGICLCAGLAACQTNMKQPNDAADSPMMTGKADQEGTVNDSSHTAAAADSQKVGAENGAPTDTTSQGSVKLNK